MKILESFAVQGATPKTKVELAQASSHSYLSKHQNYLQIMSSCDDEASIELSTYMSIQSLISAPLMRIPKLQNIILTLSKH